MSVAETPKAEAGTLKKLVNYGMFFGYLAYVQAACLQALAIIPLGASVTHGAIAAHCLNVLRTRFTHSRNSSPILDDTSRPVVFLSNHRSWGDFIVDSAILNGASFVARRMVIWAVPVSALWGWLRGWLWLFDRRAKHKEGAVTWMANFIKSSHQNFPGKGVVLYAEGTRSLEPNGLPPRPGGIAAAYQLGWPVQCIITTNKEHILGERNFELGIGTHINTCISEPVYPEKYQSADAFVEATIEIWHKTWAEAYSMKDMVERDTAALPGIRPLAMSKM